MRAKILILLVLTVSSCRRDHEVVFPKTENITESVYAPAAIKSKNQYEVYSTVNGLIDEIFVSEGDVVLKDALIMKISDEPSSLDMSNAQLAAEYADLRANEYKLREADISRKLALLIMQNDSLLLARQRNLWSQNIGSLNDLEKRELDYRNSATQYAIAHMRYQDVERQLRFSSRQAATNLKISTTVADDYQIKAVSNSKVYKVFKRKGEVTSTVSPVAILGDANEFVIEMLVDEYDISRIVLGQRIFYSMDSYKNQIFEAIVSEITPLMNEESRTFIVTGVLVSRPHTLYPNLSAEANIFIRSRENALTVPTDCVIGDTMVVLENGDLRKVEIGLKDFRKAEIVSGLTANDKIRIRMP